MKLHSIVNAVSVGASTVTNCAPTDTLDRFMTGGCYCANGQYSASYNSFLSAINLSDHTKSSVGGLVGTGCVTTPENCYMFQENTRL
jgi:hypothetical protein